MLEIKDICFERDNKKILDHINMKLDLNKFIAITGPNGSGKSTLAKIIMGIEKPDSGNIIFNGQDITNLKSDERARLGIGFAFQQPVKFKGITVYDLLKIASKKEISKVEACKILSKVGLCAKEYVDREVNASLSGGELKRIEIATVVARESILTIFDEPEAGIDLWSFEGLISIFQKLKNKTVIIVSHQRKILEIADNIVILNANDSPIQGKAKTMIKQLESKNICYKLSGGKNE